MPFREDAQQLIQQKKFEDVESLWMAQLDGDVSDVDGFLATAKSLRKAEQRTQSDTLLGLLNDALKDVFKRPPLIGTADLRGYVFPSGHAMGSFAVAAALIAIAWPTRWRRAALAAGATAVLVIGVSLPVFGVHYPTDVLAGWCVASAWTTALVLALPARVFD